MTIKKREIILLILFNFCQIYGVKFQLFLKKNISAQMSRKVHFQNLYQGTKNNFIYNIYILIKRKKKKKLEILTCLSSYTSYSSANNLFALAHAF